MKNLIEFWSSLFVGRCAKDVAYLSLTVPILSGDGNLCETQKRTPFVAVSIGVVLNTVSSPETLTGEIVLQAVVLLTGFIY